MFGVPAWAWRGGSVLRAVCVGIPAGAFAAALVFAESGVMLGAVITFAVTSVFYGVLMARRMSRLWPAAKDLSGAQRATVVGAARRGGRLDDARLTVAAIGYASGLREAREQARRGQWLLWLGAAAVVVFAVLDSVSGPPRTAAVSWLFVVFFAFEIFWWPRLRDRLVVNAERTAQLSRGDDR
jgi:membrane protein implicated in regulation of membrane protease activity